MEQQITANKNHRKPSTLTKPHLTLYLRSGIILKLLPRRAAPSAIKQLKEVSTNVVIEKRVRKQQRRGKKEEEKFGRSADGACNGLHVCFHGGLLVHPFNLASSARPAGGSQPEYSAPPGMALGVRPCFIHAPRQATLVRGWFILEGEIAEKHVRRR